ncbi:putative membrane protein [Arenibacter nanhaiticus]|uniref:Putative membrane protein n=2 Tax=Arenibacter nanhaiticus TaxID=558155 RepID=A0A1M6J0M9_9FLAO|nr:putative membrane protein [Arenibacter nanhaiticus]
MGAADVVPGVSGGTIAFISGIYEELISSINNVNLSLLKTLKKEGFTSFWKQLNGNFLLALVSGIAISVVSLAKLISWLLENQAIPLWSFFFGLVIASVFFVGKEIQRWNTATILMLVLGAVVAYFITSLPPSANTDSLPYLFFSGALAICAMILPGISGAFILVLLGSYKTILEAVHERDLKIIITVGFGAIFGLLSFSKLLKWMFSHYKNLTLAILTGFILGSLNKIWPWKEVLETKTFGEKIITIKEQNISPLSFDGDPQILWAILLGILGFSLIFMLEKLATKK